MEFIERLKRIARQHPDRIAVVDHDGARSTSYRELFCYAMRVNRYLQNRGIGKEDTVGIYYPKGMEYIATRIGVMMAGAAWVALEDLMGKERIDYVVNDCSCVLVMSGKEWEEAMELSECPDFRKADPHDLAFYIYTSGSIGRPKGAIQEYGIYDLMWAGLGKGFLYEYVYPEGDEKREELLKFANVIPESFVGGVYMTVGLLGFGCTLHVLSWETAKDPVKLGAYFNKHMIDSTFMTPTFLKVLQQLNIASMRVGYTGGEIVSGVERKGFDVVNIYGPSEFGYPTCHFKLDRSYDNTPIGYPTEGSEIVLLDENGNFSDEGELCIYLPFFRGYNKLPGENERAFVMIQGRRFLRTSDYASVDKNGRYTILGRIDEMVKINGNRVELAEVESAVKKALNIEFCSVKAFKKKNGTPLLCAYYKAESELSSENISRILTSYLPGYMIPQRFVRILEIPLNQNGKVDKLRLPNPDDSDICDTYEEPENDIQRTICEAFETVLESNKKIGINDDFFELGGDSVKAMLVIIKCSLKDLCVQNIYEGRTAKRIDELIKTSVKKDVALSDTEAPFVRVNASQDYLLRVQAQNPESSVLNLPVRFVFDPLVDLARMANAIEKAILLHPSLYSTIEETADGFIQKFDKTIIPKIVPEKMSESELELTVNDFVRPFRFDNTPMFHCRLIETQKSKIGLLDICHAICDGSSYHKLLEDVGNIYRNEPVARDDYIVIRNEENSFRDSDAYSKTMDYFRERYDRAGCVTLPATDHSSRENVDDKFVFDFQFTREEVEKISDIYGFGRVGFYVAAAALALSGNRNNKNVAFEWTWNGRYDIRRVDSIGCFIIDLPVTFALEESLSVEEFLKEVADQIKDGIANGRLSYWEEIGSYSGEDLLCLIFQGDIYDYGNSDDIVRSISELPSQNKACDNKMDLEILDSRDEFGVLVDYDAGVYERSTAEAFADTFCKACCELLKVKDNSASVSVMEVIEEIKKTT
ncbi:AMP-binding protein [Butyrivibrio sp. AE2015]|uniref:AMP-binding protein n=1 Tax=Butyrivibrio sp. AE2015 TaxID=1280663 RepID=UPI0003B493AC|nr:AMP-binding protein [Butyrivibrio sp. AE2015]